MAKQPAPKTSPSSSLSPRVAAALAACRVLQDGESLSTILPSLAGRVSPVDRGLLQELSFGVCRFQPRLQAITRELLKSPFKAKDQDIHCLLLVGLYQLLYLDTPAHAAIHETVEGARSLKKPWATGVLNGVLRNFLRQKEALLEKVDQSDAACYSHPNWLLKRLRQAWPQHWQQIVQANNGRGPMTLRVNSLRTSREAFLGRLQEAGIEASPTPYSSLGVQLAQPLDVSRIPGFGEGHCSVQDEAAQLCAQLLELAPGQRVLDACAAPGGKTCAILETEPALASLWAIDQDPARLARVEENLARLELHCELRAADVGNAESWWDGVPFDRILLDVPCSATGVIRRHPDIKLLRRNEDIPALANTQARLLRECWKTLKAGGVLLYATCSILPDENVRIIEHFVAEQADAQLDSIDAPWGLAMTAGRQLLPKEQGHDGFFYARLRKTSG